MDKDNTHEHPTGDGHTVDTLHIEYKDIKENKSGELKLKVTPASAEKGGQPAQPEHHEKSHEAAGHGGQHSGKLLQTGPLPEASPIPRGRSSSPTRSLKLSMSDALTPAWWAGLNLTSVWDIIEDEPRDEVTVSTAGKLITLHQGKVTSERDHGKGEILNVLQYQDLVILFPKDGEVLIITKDEKPSTLYSCHLKFKGYYNDNPKSQFVLGKKILNCSRNVGIIEDRVYYVSTKGTLVQICIEDLQESLSNNKPYVPKEVANDVEDFVISEGGNIFTLSENGLIRKLGTDLSSQIT